MPSQCGWKLSFFPVKPWNLRLKPRIVSCWWSIVITEPVSSKQSTAVKVPNGRHFCSSQLNARFTLKLPSVRRGADSFARSCAWKHWPVARSVRQPVVWCGSAWGRSFSLAPLVPPFLSLSFPSSTFDSSVSSQHWRPVIRMDENWSWQSVSIFK